MFQTVAMGVTAAEVCGAGFIGGEPLFCSRLVPIDLPAAGTLAAFALMADEAPDIFRGIAQEEADLVGKIFPGPESFGQLPQTGPLTEVFVPGLFQQIPGGLVGQIPVQTGRTEEVEDKQPGSD